MEEIKKLLTTDFNKMSHIQLKSFIFLCRIEGYILRKGIGLNPKMDYRDMDKLTKKQLIEIAKMSMQLTF